MGMGRGMGGGMSGGFQEVKPSISSNSQTSYRISKEEELQDLKKQYNALKSQLNQIMEKIDNLERENRDSGSKTTGISKIKKILKDK